MSRYRIRIHSGHGTSTRPDWRDNGLCATHYDPDLWHPDGTSGRYDQQIDEAKAICRTCPVMEACQAWAFDQREQHGVWGGLSAPERRNIWRRRTTREAA